MRASPLALLPALLILLALAAAPALAQIGINDDFDRPALGAGYTVIRGDAADLRVGDRRLALDALPGTLDGGVNSAQRVVIMDDLFRGDFGFGTSMDIVANNTDEAAGFLFYTDDDTYVLVRERMTADGIVMDVVTEPDTGVASRSVMVGPHGAPRIERSGGNLRITVLPSPGFGETTELASFPWPHEGHIGFVAYNPGSAQAPPGVASFYYLQGTYDPDGTPAQQQQPAGGERAAPQVAALDPADRSPVASTEGDFILTATPGGSVSYVEFYMQGPRDPEPFLVGVSMTPPYEHPVSMGDHRPGTYTFSVRAYDTQGTAYPEARTEVLLESPRSTPTEAVTGILVGAAVTTAGWGLASAGTSWLKLLRPLAEGAAQERFMDRTKGKGRVERAVKWHVLTFAAAAVLLAVLVAYPDAQRPEWTLPAYLESLALAGAATLVVVAAIFALEVLLTRRFGGVREARLWWVGILSLAGSCLFGSPFGSTFVAEGEPEGRRVPLGRFLLGLQVALLTLVLPLALVARFLAYDFGAFAVEAAIIIVATNLLPFDPLPGAGIWRWNRLASLGALAAGLGLYLAFELGYVGMMGMALVGLAAPVAAAALLFVGREPPAPVEASEPVAPVAEQS